MEKTIMEKKIRYIVLILCAFAACWGIACPNTDAEVYQYQDESGNWIFTDTPPPDAPDEIVQMEGMIAGKKGMRDLKKELNEQFRPRNDVDAATMATVTVTSAVGTGSGFFVSEKGYLLTNRHVIHGDTRQSEQLDEKIESIDEKIDIAKKDFEIRKQQLDREKAVLAEMKSYIQRMTPGSSQRKQMEKRYQDRLDYYQVMKKDFEEKSARFYEQEKKYESEKHRIESRQAMAGVKRTFEITLKSKEVLYAYLVRVSDKHDLALLKVDGCKTPYIYPADMNRVAQQQKVWAIGSPLNLADTVKDGTVSGFNDGYIQTNAQIYPGNSGGPLVNENGQVIGINTLKAVTRKFEGIGMAIPINTALDAFARELR